MNGNGNGNGTKELSAKLRNLFCVSELQKRDGEGVVQVKTRNDHVLEGKEAFPYGFIAKAKSGRAFVLCQGGNMDGFEILPVLIAEAVTPPELEEGDAALFTGEGGRIVLRESGDVEITNAADDYLVVLKSGGDIEVKGKSVTVKAEAVEVTADAVTVSAGNTVITDGDVTIAGGKVGVTGEVKVSGGSFECAGSVTPSGSGALCALPNCAFTGAPQVGSKAGNT